MKSKLIEKIHLIFELVADSESPIEVRKIASELTLDRVTTGRIVADLCECGYLRRVDCHRVEPGLGLVYLGQSAVNGIFFPHRAIQMHNLETKKMGINSALGTIHSNHIVYLNRCEVNSTGGNLWHFPLYGSNMALVILAVRDGVEAAFERLTEGLIEIPPNKNDSLRDSIRKRLDFFALHGYSIEYASKYFNVSFPLIHGSNVFGLSFFAERNFNEERAQALVAKGSILRERIRQLLD